MESRTQGSRPRTHKKSGAKDTTRKCVQKNRFSPKFRAFSEKRKGKQGNWRYQEPQAPKPTLNSEETKALKELRNDQNFVISKADKGNTTVVMDKTDYDKRLLTMLEDNTTYQQLQKDPTPNTEKTVNELVFQLVANNKITKIQSYRLESSNGRAPVLYGLPKLHKKKYPATTHRIFHWLSDLQFIKRPGTNS